MRAAWWPLILLCSGDPLVTILHPPLLLLQFAGVNILHLCTCSHAR